MTKALTLGALKETGYKPQSIRTEMRNNLISSLREGKEIFTGIYGYEHSVIPQLKMALLSGHNILLMGLRGQAKTRLARHLTTLLDEYIPVVKGSEIPDDPLSPISFYSKDLIEKHGDDTEIEWIHRSARYVEKLATPDVSVADLIGDVDPIKAATLKLPYSDERVLHYGLIPHAHRSIFTMNELPDLQARIQVSLFNILEENDIQIRGFKMRLPLDILFIFTANPEDYTSRGSIITPLKDRIGSQILTHYPTDIEVGKKIAQSEAKTDKKLQEIISIPPIMEDILEVIVMNARESDYIDVESGVSARMSITMRELMYSAVEYRMIMHNLNKGTARICDIWSVIPAITGKMELIYEGEQKGHIAIAMHLIDDALKTVLSSRIDIDELEEKDDADFQELKTFYEKGNQTFLSPDLSEEEYLENLNAVNGLEALAQKTLGSSDATSKEFLLFGLTETDVLSRTSADDAIIIEDPLGGMFDDFMKN